MQSATAPAPSRRKGWTPEARERRAVAAREAPRGPLPEIVVAERGGWEIALDRPDAVVLDLHAACLRRGLTRVHLTGWTAPLVVEFALRRLADRDLPRADLITTIWPDRPPQNVWRAEKSANTALRPVGLTIVTLWGGTLRLAAYERSPS